MREIKTKFSKDLFIPQEGLHVKEGKEVVVAITDGASSDGAVTGRRESAVGWAGMPVPHALTMIQSFSDEDTKELFESETNRRFATISRFALRKLIQMNQARKLRDLAIPPGNRLEALKGRLSSLYSIRINDQWRIVFRWTDAGPEQVAIVDYH